VPRPLIAAGRIVRSRADRAEMHIAIEHKLSFMAGVRIAAAGQVGMPHDAADLHRWPAAMSAVCCTPDHGAATDSMTVRDPKRPSQSQSMRLRMRSGWGSSDIDGRIRAGAQRKLESLISPTPRTGTPSQSQPAHDRMPMCSRLFGPTEKSSRLESMSVIRGSADQICSKRDFRLVTSHPAWWIS
jgi:hypothetical protein